MYGDFKEAKSGSLDHLSAVLNQRVPQVGESYLSHSNSHGDLASPPTAHTRGRAGILGLHGSSSQLPAGEYYPDNRTLLSKGPINPIATRFLEICARQNTFDQILGEIDTSGVNSDGILFQSIQGKYKELKQNTELQPSSSPSRFRFLGLSEHLQLSLMKPIGVAFVKVRRFSLSTLVLDRIQIILYHSKKQNILIAEKIYTLLV